MTNFSTQEVVTGNNKILLMSKDKKNRYLFTEINKSVCKRFIIFSVYSTTDEIPFENDDGMKVRNGIFEYYIGDITVEAKFLSDNNLWDFVYRKHQ